VPGLGRGLALGSTVSSAASFGSLSELAPSMVDHLLGLGPAAAPPMTPAPPRSITHQHVVQATHASNQGGAGAAIRPGTRRLSPLRRLERFASMIPILSQIGDLRSRILKLLSQQLDQFVDHFVVFRRQGGWNE